MKTYLKSFFISIAISLCAFFILSILLSKTALSEKFMPFGIIFVSTTSILVGGYLIGKNKKTQGMFYGSIFGLIYMLTIYFISSIVKFDFSINIETICMILAGVLRRNNRWNSRCKFIKKSAKNS